MTIPQKIGLRIKALRKVAGLSQESLANLAEIDRTYMTSVENGKRNISSLSLEKIINALGLTFFDFFNDPLFK